MVEKKPDIGWTLYATMFVFVIAIGYESFEKRLAYDSLEKFDFPDSHFQKAIC